VRQESHQQMSSECDSDITAECDFCKYKQRRHCGQQHGVQTLLCMPQLIDTRVGLAGIAAMPPMPVNVSHKCR
jgi:hypothetical protein